MRVAPFQKGQNAPRGAGPALLERRSKLLSPAAPFSIMSNKAELAQALVVRWAESLCREGSVRCKFDAI
jgi:hypothetical protein